MRSFVGRIQKQGKGSIAARVRRVANHKCHSRSISIPYLCVATLCLPYDFAEGALLDVSICSTQRTERGLEAIFLPGVRKVRRFARD